jgi:hypothetical protein
MGFISVVIGGGETGLGCVFFEWLAQVSRAIKGVITLSLGTGNSAWINDGVGSLCSYG